MREQLVSYIDLLFAGAPDAADIKQEILQNTLDRYDDLVSQGKSPEAAYSLAISGIGDISEVLGGIPSYTASPQGSVPDSQTPPAKAEKPLWKKTMTAIAVALYIMSPAPLFVLQDTTGLCGLLCFIAVATAMIMLASSGKKGTANAEPETAPSPRSELRKSIRSLIWAVGLVVYFILSFTTGGWYITWVIFPLIPAVQGLVTACMDLKEAG